MPHKKLIALDFDGVLHSYTSPWTDAATISDGPTPGAMEFLRSLIEDDRFDVVVVSSRLSKPDGGVAVFAWLRDHLVDAFGNVGEDYADSVRLSVERPPAFLTIDDRAMRFDGKWPDLGTLAAFKPWNKRPPAAPCDFDERAAKGFDPADTMETIEVTPEDLRRMLEAAWKRGTYCEYWESEAFFTSRMNVDVDRILGGDLSEAA